MLFKDIVSDLFGFTGEIYDIEGKRYIDLLSISELKYSNTIIVLKQAQEDIMTLQEQFDLLQSQYIELTKPTNPLEDYWNNKYPKANIEYVGRTWGPSTKMIPIDVRLLITPQDYHIHDILKANNLYYIAGSNVDDHIVKVYHFIKSKYYKYAYDNSNYGITEYWEFPYEILEGIKKGYSDAYDCDSFASFIVSFIIASGVPAWKCRVVVGNCAGGGHSTVYCHCDETNKFHHINSTMGGKSAYKKLSEYPTTDDAGKGNPDYMGIHNVWLSYNSLHSWHKFTSEARSGFKKEKGKNQFNIN